MNIAVDARKLSFSKAHIERVSYRRFESVPTGPSRVQPLQNEQIGRYPASVVGRLGDHPGNPAQKGN
jgi:hypothetical protein